MSTLRRHKPLARSAFRKAEGPNVAKTERPMAPLRRLERAPNYGGGTTGQAPKTEAHRNPALLDMARDRPCLLLVPCCCNHRLDTTVACHSNQSIHGKAGARKADDQWSVWGCAACHRWLDQGSAPAHLKQALFDAAHYRQVMAWVQIANNPVEPAESRRAAQWALERLEVTA